MKHSHSFHPIAVGIALFLLGSTTTALAQEASEVSEADVEKIDVLGKRSKQFPCGKSISA